MLRCVLTPSIIEQKLGLDITQCEAYCLTEKRCSIMDAPEAKRRSMVERKAIVLRLNERE